MAEKWRCGGDVVEVTEGHKNRVIMRIVEVWKL